jgi:hypothetical protein
MASVIQLRAMRRRMNRSKDGYSTNSLQRFRKLRKKGEIVE